MNNLNNGFEQSPVFAVEIPQRNPAILEPFAFPQCVPGTADALGEFSFCQSEIVLNQVLVPAGQHGLPMLLNLADGHSGFSPPPALSRWRFCLNRV